ncbi:hypothetical protein [Micromonospora sp. NPDC023814]|uniref:hypothetical protein n=1 Tax=Micromonospora sp. NPDC023814 TaxID=3154596 RepID=UPI0033E9BCCA
MTTKSPTTEHSAAALDPAAWCRDRARNYRYYEESELAMYPSNDHRDASLVEWTVRALGNADLEDSPRLLAVIAAQHHLELNPTGSVEWLQHRVKELTAELEQTRAALTESRTQAATYANEVGRLTAKVADLGMFKTRYFEVQEVLDEALGTEEEDGSGEGIVQDVRLLAQQRDALRPVVEAAKAWADRYGTTGDEYHLAATALFAAVKALPNDQEPCGICSGYGCPDCREDESIDPQGAGWTQGDNFHADRSEVSA